MPLMTAGLLKKLAAARGGRWDAMHFSLKFETFPQPFPLLLHRRVAQRVARRIKTGKLSVLSLLDSLSVKTVSVQRVSEMARFANVNTPAELRRLTKG
jgi:molybdopterin-guanine dinucleotide biosynthesis protein A